MNKRKFHVCWTMDCESTHPNINDPQLGENAVRGFINILDDIGCRATLFVIPEEATPLREIFRWSIAQGHEIAIHLHPQASGELSDYFGMFSYERQEEILRRGIACIREHLLVTPVSCRPGYCSANDSTFRVMAHCGIRQSSASMPGRRMSQLASNWTGAPLFAHYTHCHNRFLTGTMDLVEIPVSVDWESMVWGGCHPQDLRIEYTDAKNHSYLIEKIMRRQVEEELPFFALVIVTHNLFRYADVYNFRRETMHGMIETLRSCAKRLDVEIVGSTIAKAAEDFRQAVPLEATA